jgi:D-alanyl-D-alanine carboxypeptidase/D-alanyl-D-alanine-endopeptidase (penicillin-binding protein 4)
MAARLRTAFDPRRWDAGTRRAVNQLRARRGLEPTAAATVVVRGRVGPLGDATGARPLVVHRSNPLRVILKRMNAYSNNDIDRLSASLGDASELTAALAERLGPPQGTPQLASYSGLGTSRMTARQVVRLLRELERTCEASGLTVADVLPMSGCDPGTLRGFPHLGRNGVERSVVAKTGTLTSTDGGVAVLAGFLHSAQGDELAFCLASPESGQNLLGARREQERWVLDRLAADGGARPGACGAPVRFSDTEVLVEPAAPPASP